MPMYGEDEERDIFDLSWLEKANYDTYKLEHPVSKPYKEETGFFGDMAKDVAIGGLTFTKTVLGSSLEAMSIPNPIDDVVDDILKYSESLKPDVSQYHGLEGKAKTLARNVATSGPTTLGLFALSAANPFLGVAGFGSLATGLFEESRNEYLSVNPHDAQGSVKHAMKTTLSETGTHVVSAIAPLMYARYAIKATKGSAGSIDSVSKLLKPLVKKDYVGLLGKNIITEAPLEGANSYYQTLLANDAGISDANPWEAAAMGFATGTAISIGFSIASVPIVSHQRNALRTSVENGDANAINTVHSMLAKKTDQETADVWKENVTLAIENKINFKIDEGFDQLTEGINKELSKKFNLDVTSDIQEGMGGALDLQPTNYSETYSPYDPEEPKTTESYIANAYLDNINNASDRQLKALDSQELKSNLDMMVTQGFISQEKSDQISGALKGRLAKAEGLRQVRSERITASLVSDDHKISEAAVDFSFSDAGINRETGKIEKPLTTVAGTRGAPVDERILGELKSREAIKGSVEGMMTEAGLVSPGQSLDDALGYLGYEPSPTTKPTAGQRVAQYTRDLDTDRGEPVRQQVPAREPLTEDAQARTIEAMRTRKEPTAEETLAEVEQEEVAYTPADSEKLQEIRSSIAVLEAEKKAKSETVETLGTKEASLKAQAKKTTKLTEKKKLNDKAKATALEAKKTKKSIATIDKELKAEQKKAGKIPKTMVPAANIGDAVVAPEPIVDKELVETTAETYVSPGPEMVLEDMPVEERLVEIKAETKAEAEELTPNDLAANDELESTDPTKMTETEVAVEIRRIAEKEGKPESVVRKEITEAGYGKEGTKAEYTDPTVIALLSGDAKKLYALAKARAKEMLQEDNKAGGNLQSVSIAQAIDNLYNRAYSNPQVIANNDTASIEGTLDVVQEVKEMERARKKDIARENQISWETQGTGRETFNVGTTGTESYLIVETEIPMLDKDGEPIVDNEGVTKTRAEFILAKDNENLGTYNSLKEAQNAAQEMHGPLGAEIVTGEQPLTETFELYGKNEEGQVRRRASVNGEVVVVKNVSASKSRTTWVDEKSGLKVATGLKELENHYWPEREAERKAKEAEEKKVAERPTTVIRRPKIHKLKRSTREASLTQEELWDMMEEPTDQELTEEAHLQALLENGMLREDGTIDLDPITVEQGNGSRLLDFMKKDGSLPIVEKLLPSLNKEKLENVSVRFVKDEAFYGGLFGLGQNDRGLYIEGLHEVLIPESAMNDVDLIQTLVHEVVHAISVRELQQNKGLMNELEAIFNKYKEVATGNKELDYSLTSPFEFLSEGLSNPDVISLLESTPSTKIKTSQSLFQKFKDLISRLLGLKDKTMMDDLISLTSRISDVKVDEAKVGDDTFMLTKAELSINRKRELEEFNKLKETGDDKEIARSLLNARKVHPVLTIKEKTVGGLKATAKTIAKMGGDTSARLGLIHPSLGRIAFIIENGIASDLHKLQENSTKFDEKCKKWVKSDSGLEENEATALIEYVFLGTDKYSVNKRKEILGEELYEKVVADDKWLNLEADKAGLKEFKDIENYFTRRVKDFKGLERELKGDEAYSPLLREIDERFNRIKERNPNYEPDKDLIMEKVISDAVNGGRFLTANLKTPGSMKKRTIREVFPNLVEFYHNPIDSRHMHIKETVERINFNKGLGISKKSKQTYNIERLKSDINKLENEKEEHLRSEAYKAKIQDKKNRLIVLEGYHSDKNLELSNDIASRLTQLSREEKISNDDIDLAIRLVRSRMIQKPGNKIIADIKNIGVAVALGQFTTSLIQVTDIVWPIHRAGFRTTVEAIFSDIDVNPEVLNLTRHFSDFTSSKTNKLVDTVLKYSGLQLMDNWSKSVNMKVAILEAKKQTREEFVKRNRKFFTPKEAGLIWEDVNNGIVDSGRVRGYMFSVVMATQPITMFNMSEAFLNNPNFRPAWSLKNYGIKQLNNIGIQAYEDIQAYKKGEISASKMMSNTGSLILLIVAMGASVDEVKDFILQRNKDVKFSDRFWDNFLNVILTNQYSTNRLFSDGPGTVLKDSIFGLPALRALDAPFKDMGDWYEGRDHKYNAFRILPFVGQPGYEWFTEASEKKELGRKSKAITLAIEVALESKGSASYAKELIREYNKDARKFEDINPINFRTRWTNAKRKMREESK